METGTTEPARAGAAMGLGPMAEEPADWAEIKEAYERGFDPIVVIAKRHGVKYRQIAAHAHRHKWRRLAVEGSSANAVEVSIGAMTRDLHLALKRQLKGLNENLGTALKRRNVTAASKLDIINATIRGLMGATSVVEKVLKINARNAERVEHLRTKDGGDDPRAEFERRIMGYLVGGTAGGRPEGADA